MASPVFTGAIFGRVISAPYSGHFLPRLAQLSHRGWRWGHHPLIAVISLILVVIPARPRLPTITRGRLDREVKIDWQCLNCILGGCCCQALLTNICCRGLQQQKTLLMGVLTNPFVLYSMIWLEILTVYTYKHWSDWDELPDRNQHIGIAPHKAFFGLFLLQQPTQSKLN